MKVKRSNINRREAAGPCCDWFLMVAAPIALGAAIYIVFRSRQLLVFQWLDATDLLGTTMIVRSYVAGVCLPNCILYSLPDGLWVLAGTNCMLLIWHGRPPAFWLLATFVLAAAGEVGQAIRLVPGTYEHADMVAYTVGFLLADFRRGQTR
ncbi:MAG: hypothetical protein ACREHD_22475 [Pirellulales bacterium]